MDETHNPLRADTDHIVNGPRSPSPGGPYSQSVIAGPFVFCSGQRPEDPSTGSIPTRFEDQAEQVLRNLQDGLHAAGCDLTDLVKVNVYLSDLENFHKFNEVYKRHIREPYPARTTVACELRGIEVEVDAIAFRTNLAQDFDNGDGGPRRGI